MLIDETLPHYSVINELDNRILQNLLVQSSSAFSTHTDPNKFIVVPFYKYKNLPRTSKDNIKCKIFTITPGKVSSHIYA